MKWSPKSSASHTTTTTEMILKPSVAALEGRRTERLGAASCAGGTQDKRGIGSDLEGFVSL